MYTFMNNNNSSDLHLSQLEMMEPQKNNLIDKDNKNKKAFIHYVQKKMILSNKTYKITCMNYVCARFCKHMNVTTKFIVYCETEIKRMLSVENVLWKLNEPNLSQKLFLQKMSNGDSNKNKNENILDNP